MSEATDPARVLVMVEQPLLVEVIKLTLNHGGYVTREALIIILAQRRCPDAGG